MKNKQDYCAARAAGNKTYDSFHCKSLINANDLQTTEQNVFFEISRGQEREPQLRPQNVHRIIIFIM